MDATAVHLDGNNITHLNNPGFIGRRRIEAVYLNSSSIRSISNVSFEGLVNLKVLYLDSNYLERLEGSEFTGLEQLRELYLQDNWIETIAAETFSALKSLTVLRLDGNRLAAWPAGQLAANPLLTSLWLAGNPWSCACSFLNPFLVVQWKLGSKLADKAALRCVDGPADAPKPMTAVACSSGDDVMTSVPAAIASVDYTPILVAVFLSVLVVVVAYLVIFTFRKHIKAWFRARAGGPDKDARTHAPAADKLFDVFISYAGEDRGLVEDQLAGSLEHGATSYRLCLHQRDFPPSTPLADSVSVAVETSVKTVLVLSRAYILTQWPLVRPAVMAGVRGRGVKVVAVAVEPLEQLDSCPELRQLLDDCPVLRWGEQGFWSKLRYYLPEPVYLTFHRNVTLRGGSGGGSVGGSVGGSGGPNGTINSRSQYEPVAATAAVWTYFVEDSHSSLDTNTTEMSDSSNDSAQPPPPALDHTYYSIDAAHIYHTLDPGGGGTVVPCHHAPGKTGRLYINRNLDLVDHKGGNGLMYLTEQTAPRPPQLFSITPPPSFSVAQGKKMSHKDNSEYVV